MLNTVEISWIEDGGEYTLVVGWHEDMQEFEREEVERILHVHGFVSQGNDRWTAPEDPTAPLEAWEEIGRYGYAVQMDLETLPPAIEAKVLADLERLPLI
ncbi:hypothetical protein G8E10_24910 [Rhizobiaceae bacterium CRRU44]|uniref:Uncharacterized protein n=1 Tax=Ferranicluibacter rubi TaxID=2715133 RepID=A0AA43ZJR3_9HYPH|nr:hypothetical protein [Ferranicluibacter rubi]NHT78944.1 hypothetical protein [Ferranicluibacter rubi]